MKKPFQLTLFGATGVTGRNAFKYLSEHAPSDMQWAIAGRDQQRLDDIRSQAKENRATPQIVLADLDDPKTIEEMIKNTDVLIHLAGPYAKNGEQFFAQCIKHQTDYLDIGGETFFLREMILKYHQKAKDRGVKIVPTAGYESVPFDLLTRMAIVHLRDVYHEACAEIKIITSFLRNGNLRDNRISGGSIGTMRNILDGDSINAFNDMSCLLPNSRDRAKIRQRNKVKYKARFDEDVEAYTGPLQPAPFLNVPVILRSAHLYEEIGQGYGGAFTYRDAMTMEFYADTIEGQEIAAKKSANLNRMTSIAMAGPKFMRSLIRKRLDGMGIKPGDGPSEESLPFVDYELRLFATSESNRKLKAIARAKGHPGYLSTANIVAEAGLSLCCARESLTEQFGVLTPATGLGLGFLQRLENAGVEMTVC
ncbi:MAG: saccharopine dehydrogenase NADP-binding domain-containing protein [Pseudomonadota bacterium]